MTRLVVCS